MPDKESNLFDQLRSKQLVGVSKSDFSSSTDQTFIEECNLDEFKLINVIGQATNMQSQSGGIPGTQTVLSASNTAGDIYETFAPAAGETWELVALSGTMATGITRMEYKLYDSNTSQYVEFAELTANGTAEMEGYPVTISHPVTFVTHPRGTYGSGTNYTYYSVIQVR